MSLAKLKWMQASWMAPSCGLEQWLPFAIFCIPAASPATSCITRLTRCSSAKAQKNSQLSAATSALLQKNSSASANERCLRLGLPPVAPMRNLSSRRLRKAAQEKILTNGELLELL
jgi:hypothetical protein